MKCPRCQHDNPAHARFCLECGAPIGAILAPGGSYADLQAEIERLRLSLVEAIDKATEASEQQRATSEILRVISRSQTDVQPVFDVIVRSAVRLLGASHGGVYRVQSGLIHVAAHAGYSASEVEEWRNA